MKFNLPKTENKTFEFIGIPSGDYESFCWDVDKETFTKITGKEPKKYYKSYFNEGLYRIYPNKFYGFDKPKCKMIINIEVLKDGD